MLLARLVVWMSLLGIAILGAGAVCAQEYPNKPIRILASGPGGITDFAARLIAQGLAGGLGQQVIVDNRPSGVIPIDIVAKAPPGALNYYSSGAGSSTHLAAALFAYMTGTNIVRIPFKSASAGMTSLVSGEVQLAFATAGGVASYIKSGRLRALAITSAQPSALFPGLPTVTASGVPGYEAVQMGGIFAPAKTPAAIINRLNQETVRFLRTAEAKDRFSNAGVEAVGSLL